jgi:hypothetical protein
LDQGLGTQMEVAAARREPDLGPIKDKRATS